MHVHLDAVGGMAGDMFAAAMLDAWPEFAPRVQTNVRLAALLPGVSVTTPEHTDGVLTGHRFVVERTAQDAAATDHQHTHWAGLRAHLQAGELPEPVLAITLGIFTELARAEAAVHGTTVDDVAFHEVGHWDSIADIVAAATMIDALGADSWSVGPVPLGSGWVETAHGRLPVPTPATTLLLQGFSVYDDGRPGERVTPTGAAMLRFLSPSTSIGGSARALDRTGVGFGARTLRGMSNVVRAISFLDAGTAAPPLRDAVGVLRFEIDDQTGEDLAIALDQLRATDGVLDVTQTPALGKKGRMVSAIQVLTRPDALDAVSAGCLQQTTTLGVRRSVEDRVVLERRSVVTDSGIRVKVVRRPDGRSTAKAEADDVAACRDGHRARADIRRTAEAEASGVHHD
ncbi:MAG TPA: LarC family nickel insertion protein [Flexivirga sp.]|uniref:LarC family nickel insertion protein n=1 Tax=Flexivirga sp. TaxID=1962927 RepID=UPI002BB7E222|nr:LarC family nickel insertion protein [Flexivirga sp.]HWC24165.1 LarC family nickel insertion protein [Flexivirga sp.]